MLSGQTRVNNSRARVVGGWVEEATRGGDKHTPRRAAWLGSNRAVCKVEGCLLMVQEHKEHVRPSLNGSTNLTKCLLRPALANKYF